MKEEPKYNSLMSAKKNRKATKRKIKNTTLAIFILFFLTIVIYVANIGGKQKANQIRDNISSVAQSAAQNSIIDTQRNTTWNLLLVNYCNYIPDNYSVKLKTIRNGYQVDERIYLHLQEMFDAAKKVGVYPLIGEAYRTAAQQQKMLDDKIKAYITEGYSKSEAETLAKKWVAVPGTSEHQLGLALDINAEKGKCTNEEVYQWLAKNSYKYGFILRYPSDKVEITGTSYEPWHYRYVGQEVAKEIYEQGICLEEYLKNYK
ncbi:M15 family metallopeptidase [[Clostridium] fimetarium]|uniref:LD-carboxypeptidase LdcB, LAS superfamily n=1 Tax=[Clostridium] fimetarium TaxID=99656 RepID=A0A1I0R685_9FIRM|nr:M15 family metallopeptidase [[Clostridium] fimetarium]SEW35906.1 LD-carboxypeptidase LdcB, LAS superfamily [[Clostridium] fimetarium]